MRETADVNEIASSVQPIISIESIRLDVLPGESLQKLFRKRTGPVRVVRESMNGFPLVIPTYNPHIGLLARRSFFFLEHLDRRIIHQEHRRSLQILIHEFDQISDRDRLIRKRRAGYAQARSSEHLFHAVKGNRIRVLGCHEKRRRSIGEIAAGNDLGRAGRDDHFALP